jgi:hypothetical protein
MIQAPMVIVSLALIDQDRARYGRIIRDKGLKAE